MVSGTMLTVPLFSDLNGRDAKRLVAAVQQAAVFFKIALHPVEMQDGWG